MPSFTVESEFRTTPAAFWGQMTMDAVNAELSPLVRMSVPGRWRRAPLDQWVPGKVLFRSVILLFGFVPVDLHSLRLEALYPDQRGFLECSHSWCNRLWQHERTTTPTAAGCIVRDTVTVEGRIPLVAKLLLPIYRLVFRHRHQRLKTLYGQVGG